MLVTQDLSEVAGHFRLATESVWVEGVMGAEGLLQLFQLNHKLVGITRLLILLSCVQRGSPDSGSSSLAPEGLPRLILTFTRYLAR